MMVELSVYERMLLRDALKIAASRHKAEARFAAKHKVVPTRAEHQHEITAGAMLTLRAKLAKLHR